MIEAPLAQVDWFSSRSTQEPMGTLAIPVRDHLNVATAMSLMHTDLSFLGPETLDRVMIQGSVLTLQRNGAVQGMRGKFVLFIDDDMVWDPKAIGQLVQSWFDLKAQFGVPVMVGGLCFRRSPPFQPTLYMRENPTSGAYNFLERWDDGWVEVDATGCAFLLIPVEAFEAIAGTPMPPYDVRRTMRTLPSFFRWDKAMGEDLRFCQDARAAGVRIFVDTRIEIGHVAEITVGKRHFWQAVMERTDEEEERRKKVNDALGLPTLIREEARENLGW